MYFKKLELVGFKSFFDKTTLNFEPGVTAVVGPNGCGKSNIFDSIRWVLGEQSAKSLRGSDMQDVIFNGTDNKEALGMAEVSLTFDNENKFFNVPHPEVVITRRLFRSGESEYLLNKTPVRLKDILDILLGTGIGAESYSIVAQGKIDLVLSSRPEDRRLVFDEASGITKYKAQKRETLRKLEETEQNLLRVNDIVTEVKRQIGSLERQANKARKYKEVFEELRSKEINLSVLERKELLRQKDEIIRQLRELETSEASLLGVLREQEGRISNRQAEIKSQEENILALKNLVLNLENSIIRNSEHINFNKEKIVELAQNLLHLEKQREYLDAKLAIDEQKLNNIKEEYAVIKKDIEEKSLFLLEKETELSGLAGSIKHSLELVADAKKQIMDLALKITNTKNEVSDFGAKEQIYLARKKRLDIEKAKVFEEKVQAEAGLSDITREVDGLKKVVEGLNQQISNLKLDSEQEAKSLTDTNSEIAKLEKERLTLQSHKEFLAELKTKYEDMGESINAVIYLDKAPNELISGLVVKIKNGQNVSETQGLQAAPESFKLSGEAKPIELDTQKIDEKINKLLLDLSVLKEQKLAKERKIEEFNKIITNMQQDLRNQEIALANKDTSRLTMLEQFSKIKEEEDIIVIELQDIHKEISVLEANIEVSKNNLSSLILEGKRIEDLIAAQEQAILSNGRLREDVLVITTQTKTELDALNKSMALEQTSLKQLEDNCNQGRENRVVLERQLEENKAKSLSLEQEIKEAELLNIQNKLDIENQNNSLKQAEEGYRNDSSGIQDIINKIDLGRSELDNLKNKLYELQMSNKDIDYRSSSIKERMLQAYKVDLENEQILPQDTDSAAASVEIGKLKEKLDSYGTVNLVAIEEYDELKKRYDFLITQQTDLLSAKESLHQAILKINRVTKQMFMETFEKVREEFRNYFKLLFNGGDAQVFLVNEQDPLESGIEIICRPPGKKLQNVLLLSGGEKTMSAIALIFAIFKVKPSPFCVLDEIDAALDEANVDRFARMLQEFAKVSQFIVITHNKRTIANADVMYGITMQQSGISKIVSVKFAKNQNVPEPV